VQYCCAPFLRCVHFFPKSGKVGGEDGGSKLDQARVLRTFSGVKIC
jgi:hypothetical protein